VQKNTQEMERRGIEGIHIQDSPVHPFGIRQPALSVKRRRRLERFTHCFRRVFPRALPRLVPSGRFSLMLGHLR
jgi:hypothetical protein